MKYILLLVSFSTFANCDLYEGSEVRYSLCYNEPLTFTKVELMDHFRDPELYPKSVWVKDPRNSDLPSTFYLTTLLKGGKIKYED